MSSWVASLQWQPVLSWRHLSAPSNLGEAFYTINFLGLKIIKIVHFLQVLHNIIPCTTNCKVSLLLIKTFFLWSSLTAYEIQLKYGVYKLLGVEILGVDILGSWYSGSWLFGSWHSGSWHFGSWHFGKNLIWVWPSSVQQVGCLCIYMAQSPPTSACLLHGFIYNTWYQVSFTLHHMTMHIFACTPNSNPLFSVPLLPCNLARLLHYV